MSSDKRKNVSDRLTALLHQWADKYSKSLEPESIERLASLIEQSLEEKPENGQKRRRHLKRWDHKVIEKVITPGSRVLDLGCGSGELLERLIKHKQIQGQGIELDPEKVYECVARGVSVFQTDLDKGLPGWPDDSFDFVILEETLQTVHQPVKVLSEMIRVGKWGIVSFPNFGYWHVRLELGLGGKMPIIESLPFPWYETPNIHLCSLEDFMAWADQARLEIIETHVLSEGKVRPMRKDDNLFAEEVLFIVQGNNKPF